MIRMEKHTLRQLAVMHGFDIEREEDAIPVMRSRGKERVESYNCNREQNEREISLPRRLQSVCSTSLPGALMGANAQKSLQKSELEAAAIA